MKIQRMGSNMRTISKDERPSPRDYCTWFAIESGDRPRCKSIKGIFSWKFDLCMVSCPSRGMTGTSWPAHQDGRRSGKVSHRLLMSLFLLLISGVFDSVAWAQRRQFRNAAVPTEGILMPAPREIQVLIDEARANIEAQQWSEATLALGLLLGLEESEQEDSTGIDFFLVDEADAEKFASPNDSVYQRVFRLIESLPLEATKFMDLRYGVRANQLLEKAIRESDWAAIGSVAGRFGFTTAGQDACVIMGEHWLRKGEPRRAARFLSMAFRQKSAMTRLGPELGVLTASAYQSASMQSEAIRCIESTRNQFSTVSFDWGGSKVGWEGRLKRTEDVLDALRLEGSHAINRIVKQPLYFGGNANRNSDTNAGVPLPILRWHTELHESKQHKDNLEKTLKEKLAQGKSTTIPSRVPIAVGQWLIASTYDQRIVAVDIQTGRLGWECFYSGMPLGFSMDRFPSRDSHALNLAAPDYLIKRVWGESAVGMPTSDGQRIFSISELPAIDIAESFAIGQNARVSKPQGARNFNVMQCWSIREEGKIKWEVGGQKSPAEPKLAGALFLGAPLPHDQELLVIGEINSDVYLFALAPETGRLLWRQPMATNLSPIATDPTRRSLGVVPAADGSIIVCPTLSGYLVGFDSVSRSLLWSFQYPIKIVPGSQNQVTLFGQSEPGDFSPFLGRSADVSVTIHEGVALFAPSDGDAVYAISIDSGKLLWQSDSKSDLVRYVAGAWNGTALIANQSSLAAFDLKTGKERWPQIQLAKEIQVVGRGVRKGAAFFLPTSSQEILQIDLEKGVISETVKVERPLGNLISSGDRLICASPYQLDCYTVREAFQSQLKDDLQKNSVSRVGLTKQGELALAIGDFDSALSFLEQAKAMEPNSAEVLILLNKVGVAALSADFAKYVDRVNLSKDLAFDRERVPYLRLLVRGLQSQGRYKEALLKMLELSEIRISQRQDQIAGSDLAVQTPQWTVQDDRWISTQIRRCMDKLTPVQLRELESEIETKVVSIARLQPNVRRLMMEHMESIPELENLRTESAWDLIQQSDLLQAERLLMSDGYLEKSDPKSIDALRRRTLLAELYSRTRRYELALNLLDGDVVRFNKILEGISDVTLRMREAIPLPPKTQPFKPLQEWPTGEVITTTNQVVMPPLGRPALLESMNACRWKTRVGDSLQGWSVLYGAGNFTFSSTRNEDEFRSYVDIGNQDKATLPTVHSVDSIVLIELNREIMAINTLTASNNEQNGLLWREAFEILPNEFEKGRGRPGVVPQNSWGLPAPRSAIRIASVSRLGVVVLYEDNLVCLDIATGNKLWTATGFKDCQFASFQGSLNVYQPKKKSIQHLDLRDGAILSESPLDSEWNWVATSGKYWLMESTATKYSLSLLDSADGRSVFSKQFTRDTRLALDGETSVIALQVSGALTYWNILDEKEYTTQVQSEGGFSSITAHRFGDTILVMPNSSALGIDFLQVAPTVSDPGFAPLAGRLTAISAKDGSQVWKQNNLVRQFSFPLAQDRNSPIAVFVRRLTLSKVAGTVDYDSMSIAAVDLRDGRVVFAKDDLGATRERGFVERVLSDENTISVDYLGTNVTMKFVEQGASQKATDQPTYDFGNVDEKEFKNSIEAKLKARATELQPAAPNENPTDK
jgi:outer membrane protein assembly factor BamB